MRSLLPWITLLALTGQTPPAQSEGLLRQSELFTESLRIQNWSMLTPAPEQPSCSHLKQQLGNYLESLGPIQDELIENSDYRAKHAGSIVNALQNDTIFHHSLETVFERQHATLSVEIAKKILPIGYSKIETILLINSSYVDQLELGQFFHSPARISDRGELLHLESGLNSVDICEPGVLRLIFLWDCEIQEQGPNRCVQDGTCQATRIPNPNSCQSGIQFIIDTEPIRNRFGIKDQVIKRRSR